MNILTLFGIAVGLSMDAFAVSVNIGIADKKIKLSSVLMAGVYFGTFQALMPVIGWVMGYSMSAMIDGVDHWVAFLILTVIGIKMIYEAANKAGIQARSALSHKTMLILALATSIDALATGVTLAFMKQSIIYAAFVIGLTTFVISSSGVVIGSRVGHFFEKGAATIGGIMLILVGISFLL